MKKYLFLILFVSMSVAGEENNSGIIGYSIGESFLLNYPAKERRDSSNKTLMQLDSLFSGESISNDSLFGSNLYILTCLRRSNTFVDGNVNSQNRFDVFAEEEVLQYNERRPYINNATSLVRTGGTMTGIAALVGLTGVFFASVLRK